MAKIGRPRKHKGTHAPNRIKEYRERAGMTQDELGAKLGYTSGFISRIESANKPVKLDVIDAIAVILQTSRLSLLKISEESPAIEINSKTTNKQATQKSVDGTIYIPQEIKDKIIEYFENGFSSTQIVSVFKSQTDLKIRKCDINQILREARRAKIPTAKATTAKAKEKIPTTPAEVTKIIATKNAAEIQLNAKKQNVETTATELAVIKKQLTDVIEINAEITNALIAANKTIDTLASRLRARK